MLCSWSPTLKNLIRTRSPWRTRMVGPGMRPLYVQAIYSNPGTISITLFTATMVYSRRAWPFGNLVTVPVSKSVRIPVGLNPFRA